MLTGNGTVVGNDADGVTREITPSDKSILAGSFTDRITALARAAEHGAALVYHHVVDAEANIKQWAADNAEVSSFVQAGVSAANALLQRAGVPLDAIKATAEDVVAALRKMAAADASTHGSYAPASPARETIASVASTPVQEMQQ